MKNVQGIVGIMFALSTVATGQPHYREPAVEIAGNLLYSYNDLTWGPYPGETFKRFNRSHTITIQPSIGYFVTPEFELVLEPHYAFRFYEFNYGQYLSSQFIRLEDVIRRWSHNVGINVGPVYNHRASETLMPFAGLLFGVGWTYLGFDPIDPRLGSPWRKPEITFPQLNGGVKVFFMENWAAVLLLQYSRTTNFNGNAGHTNAELALGLGLSVFL